MKVIDNILSTQQYNELKDIMYGEAFPWFYKTSVVDQDDKTLDSEDYQIQFVHNIHESMGPTTTQETFSLMWRFFEVLQPLQLIRIKANLLPRADAIVEHGYHSDTHVPGALTAIYYLNTNNGETRFENKSKKPVKSKANRLLVFPAKWKHTGTTHTDRKTRCVINFNFIPYPGKDFSYILEEEWDAIYSGNGP